MRQGSSGGDRRGSQNHQVVAGHRRRDPPPGGGPDVQPALVRHLPAAVQRPPPAPRYRLFVRPHGDRRERVREPGDAPSGADPALRACRRSAMSVRASAVPIWPHHLRFGYRQGQGGVEAVALSPWSGGHDPLPNGCGLGAAGDPQSRAEHETAGRRDHPSSGEPNQWGQQLFEHQMRGIQVLPTFGASAPDPNDVLGG